jgi:hypothetical protein
MSAGDVRQNSKNLHMFTRDSRVNMELLKGWSSPVEPYKNDNLWSLAKPELTIEIPQRGDPVGAAKHVLKYMKSRGADFLVTQVNERKVSPQPFLNVDISGVKYHQTVNGKVKCVACQSVVSESYYPKHKCRQSNNLIKAKNK